VHTLVYACVNKCVTYDDAICKLDDACIKHVNEVHASYKLSTCRQIISESLEEFLSKTEGP